MVYVRPPAAASRGVVRLLVAASQQAAAGASMPALALKLLAMAQPSQPDLIPGVLGHTRERVSVSECGIFRFVHAGSAAARSHAAARTTCRPAACSLQLLRLRRTRTATPA